MNPFFGALLVGGKSRRMGRDKCRLEINGQPLWQRQLALFQEMEMPACLLAAERPEWCPENVHWLPDVAPGNGPLGGLAAALAASPVDRVMLLGVDLPQMTSLYLKKLQAAGSPGSGVVPELDDLFQPLTAIYPTKCLPHVMAHLASPDKSFQNLLKKLTAVGEMRILPVEESERPLFRNLNTPGD